MFRYIKKLHMKSIKSSLAANVVLVALLIAGAFALTGAGATPARAAQEQRFALNSPVATITNVVLREQPSASSSELATMPVNARAVVIGGPFNDGWYWLSYAGLSGYANGKDLVQVDENYKPVPLETPTATRAPATSVPPSQPTTAPQVATPASTVAPGTAIPATATPEPSAPTTSGDYTNLWLGEMSTGGNVRSGPGLDQKVLKGWWAGRRLILYQAVTDSKGGLWYRVSEPPEAPMYVHSSLVKKVAPVKYEGARYKGRWVNINISQQIVTAYEDGKPVMVTLTSTGTKKDPTELGVWKIYYRLPKQDMKGGNLASNDYYFLKDVPYPQYFHTSGEGLHGTYWHDNFGRPMSHGCVNLSTPMSEWFYGWAKVGTIVYVHN
jgi:hypothetical protein